MAFDLGHNAARARQPEATYRKVEMAQLDVYRSRNLDLIGRHRPRRVERHYYVYVVDLLVAYLL